MDPASCAVGLREAAASYAGWAASDDPAAGWKVARGGGATIVYAIPVDFTDDYLYQMNRVASK
jgi:hypothetical protein